MIEPYASRIPARFRTRLGQVGLVALGVILGGTVLGFRDCARAGRTGQQERPARDAGPGHSQTWTCAMHPQIRAPEPGQCPICGMDLIPVTAEEGAAAADPSRVALSERARVLAEVRTTVVRRRPDASSAVRLLGRVVPDETTLKTVTAWTGGRIDRLHVKVTGQHVRAGQVIATLYSPEVFSAHQDLLVAKRQVKRMASAPASAQAAARAAQAAARQRLRLLGVPDGTVSQLEQQAEPTRAIAIRTPFAGTVIERVATEGAYVQTGAPLYKVANLRTVWVQLDAYESDLSQLALRQPVQVDVEALPGEVLEGQVAFIDPTLDPQRRTAQVRVEVDNHEGRLRPGMFAEAVVRTGVPAEPGGPLVIPATAPLFTGRRSVVYVEAQAGERFSYAPRTVRLGPRRGDVYPVVAGLSAGERVVSRGAFAIDADLQIRGGPSMMTRPDDREPGPFRAVIELPAAERKRLEPVVAAYLEIQRSLAKDDLTRAKAAAARLEAAVAEAQLSRPREAQLAWSELAHGLRGHARHLAMGTDLPEVRAAFEELSGGVAVLLQRFGNPLSEPLRLAFCPMAHGSDGASWVQQGAAIDNAYFGESMRTCGEIRQVVDPGAYLSAPEPSQRPAGEPAPAGGHRH